MLERPSTYSQPCPMKPDEADKVSQMIASHPEFSTIRISVNPDRNTYNPLQASQIPEGKVLVTFEIPYEGISMVDFYREVSRALNPESPTMPSRERSG